MARLRGINSAWRGGTIFFHEFHHAPRKSSAPSSNSCMNWTIGAARTRGWATRQCNTAVQMVDYGPIEPHEGSFDFFWSLKSCDNYDNWACLIDRYIFFPSPPGIRTYTDCVWRPQCIPRISGWSWPLEDKLMHHQSWWAWSVHDQMYHYWLHYCQNIHQEKIIGTTSCRHMKKKENMIYIVLLVFKK